MSVDLTVLGRSIGERFEAMQRQLAANQELLLTEIRALSRQ